MQKAGCDEKHRGDRSKHGATVNLFEPLGAALEGEPFPSSDQEFPHEAPGSVSSLDVPAVGLFPLPVRFVGGTPLYPPR